MNLTYDYTTRTIAVHDGEGCSLIIMPGTLVFVTGHGDKQWYLDRVDTGNFVRYTGFRGYADALRAVRSDKWSDEPALTVQWELVHRLWRRVHC